MADLFRYLELMARKGASDLFISVGAPPMLKIEGGSHAIGEERLNSQQVRSLAYSMLSDAHKQTFEQTLELNFATGVDGVGRFRFNLYRQRGEIAMVIRYIKSHIPSLESLNLPPQLKEMVMLQRGLVLVVGAAGSGKSTALASMIDHRNSTETGHILCIEDPIEFMHSHKKSVVDQREVGLDTLDFGTALHNALREAPDVILIGEIRDKETMRHAIVYAETGHLCLATLHANNANQALDRIINFFPAEFHHQLLVDLSLNLQAIVGMRLLPGMDGRRVPAVEILRKSPYVSDLIEKGDIDGLKEVMANNNDIGMQTFDQSLYDLFMHDKISRDVALQHADSANNLLLRMRLKGDFMGEGLELD
ncbi:PilT/PilU family type 4a pilus ATPase [Spongiibacter sp. KMU-158]|uniref:PilT/PilU family type 4a pilus ATPase n=1 Tax=Spongiibacter pelagi TaxID=2760804 RepID=A0A927GWL9_9GAMM|nr:PilT/PilU family type 4a pilus ATPase [Spongiibacter pelagi]MBD2859082.1 PilT/PilU family type 4a pilus ATPase [Spongiibacter pelagi]